MVVDQELHLDRLIFNLYEVSLIAECSVSLSVDTHHITTTDYHYCDNHVHVSTSYDSDYADNQICKIDKE